MFRLTCIEPDNGEFAVYINHHYLGSEDASGERLSLGEVLEQLSLLPGVELTARIHYQRAFCHTLTYSSATRTASNRSTGTTRQRLPNVWLRRLCAGSTPCFLKPTAKPWCWTKPFRTD
ncbi:TPA: hypothetical protein ACSR07_004725 [Enterobacter hormaechei subsp. steigerwaltii]